MIILANLRLHICSKFVQNFIGCNFHFLHLLNFSMFLISLLIILKHLFCLELLCLLSFNLLNPKLARYTWQIKLANTFNLLPYYQNYANTSLKSYHHQTHPKFHPLILQIDYFLIFYLSYQKLLKFQILMPLFGAK